MFTDFNVNNLVDLVEESDTAREREEISLLGTTSSDREARRWLRKIEDQKRRLMNDKEYFWPAEKHYTLEEADDNSDLPSNPSPNISLRSSQVSVTNAAGAQ